MIQVLIATGMAGGRHRRAAVGSSPGTARGNVAAAAPRRAGGQRARAGPGAVGGAAASSSPRPGLAAGAFGVFWDIPLHIDDGRDEGPLANPSHYLILACLYALLRRRRALARPARARAARRRRGRCGCPAGSPSPVGGVLLLLLRRVRADRLPARRRVAPHVRPGRDAVGPDAPGDDQRRDPLGARDGRAGPRGAARRRRAALRRAAGAGELRRRGCCCRPRCSSPSPSGRPSSTGACRSSAWSGSRCCSRCGRGLALVVGRLWLGRGGALATVALYLVLRGVTRPARRRRSGRPRPRCRSSSAEALLVELAPGAAGRALAGALRRRSPGGSAARVGFAAEYAWSQVVMPLPWTPALLAEGIPTALLAGLAGGALGALLGGGLRGELPPRPSRRSVAPAPRGRARRARRQRAVDRAAGRPARRRHARARGGGEPSSSRAFERRASPRDAEWLQVTAWQGGGRVVAADGAARRRALALRPPRSRWTAAWKTSLRLHDGRTLASAPAAPAARARRSRRRA